MVRTAWWGPRRGRGALDKNAAFERHAGATLERTERLLSAGQAVSKYANPQADGTYKMAIVEVAKVMGATLGNVTPGGQHPDGGRGC